LRAKKDHAHHAHVTEDLSEKEGGASAVIPVHEHGGHSHHTSTATTEVDFYTEMTIMLFGLSFHSFFVGLTLGLNPDDLGFLIAIFAHQFFEGLALGIRIARARIKHTIWVWIFDILFSISAPIGTCVGIGILYSLNQDSVELKIIQGFSHSFSAGILIFIALVHMMGEEMERPAIIERTSLQNAMYIGFILGSLVMVIIANWA